MATRIFINLPVNNLQQSMDFYSKIGFVNNPTFTDENAACMVLNDSIALMIMVPTRFNDFIKKPIGNAKTTTNAIYALSMESLDAMNQMADKAIAAGGTEAMPPNDYGFMQQRSFEDPDGHYWEVLYMDMSKFPQG